MPSSTAWAKNAPASSSPSDHSLNPRCSPKLMQPRAIRLTVRPEAPSRVYSMIKKSFRDASGGSWRGTPMVEMVTIAPERRADALGEGAGSGRRGSARRYVRLVILIGGLVGGGCPAGEEAKAIVGAAAWFDAVDDQ